MGKNHLTRLAAPKTWDIDRKGTVFVTKPNPGPHSVESGMPISTLLKEILKYATTTREVKKILNTNEIKIDGVLRKDFRFPVGVFDTIELGATKQAFRMIFNKKGKLALISIKREEASIKPCKIVKITTVNGKLQLNLYDGKNILADENKYKTGDTVMLSMPDNKITNHLKLDKKAAIFLIGGKHIGESGKVEDIVENRIIYKDDKGNIVETLKKYAFVIGGPEPVITIQER